MGQIAPTKKKQNRERIPWLERSVFLGRKSSRFHTLTLSKISSTERESHKAPNE